MKILCVIFAICAVALGDHNPTLDDKIVGGVAANIKDIPCQASVRLDDQHICGGSIIDKTHIVTAAHCVYEMDHSKFSVRVGNTKHKLGKKYIVKNVKQHENYNPNTHENDIAILKIRRKLKFGSTIQAIKLAKTGTNPGTKATVSGWGVTTEGSNNVPDGLRKVVVEVISNSNCSKKYDSVGQKITSDMLCTLSKGKDSCQGDSGGPLIYNNSLIGIVSWGYGCAESEYPGVNTNVSCFCSWISKHT